MQTKICPTCGCSLVRLGISDQQSEKMTFKDIRHFFCCQGCKDIFQKNPEPFVKEVADMHACPVCLAEKPTAYTVSLNHEDQKVHFCRCTFCMGTFLKTPDYYLDRLAGKTYFKGQIDILEGSCCH